MSNTECKTESQEECKTESRTESQEEYKTESEQPILAQKPCLAQKSRKPTLAKKSEDEKKPDIQEQKEMEAAFSSNFSKCIKGYHLVNDSPLKESPWEDVNATVLEASGCSVKEQSKGSHQSGADIYCALGFLSNKSAQYETGRQSFKLSSYRLTTVCSNKSCGTMDEIIAEIQARKNFQYYSILLRDETADGCYYDWFLLPSDFPALNPETYEWRPLVGKKGKNKNEVIGWETAPHANQSRMSITFSMSSQLWLDIRVTEEMMRYRMGSCTVSKGKKYNYIQLFEKET